MEIVKLIGSDVLPDDQKLTLEIARVVRLGFLQQNAFHADDTCVPHGEAVPDDGDYPLSVRQVEGAGSHGHAHVRTEAERIFSRRSSPIKYDVPNDKPGDVRRLSQERLMNFTKNVLKKNG